MIQVYFRFFEKKDNYVLIWRKFDHQIFSLVAVNVELRKFRPTDPIADDDWRVYHCLHRIRFDLK